MRVSESEFCVEALKKGNHRQVSNLGFGGVNLGVMALFLAWEFGYQRLD